MDVEVVKEEGSVKNTMKEWIVQIILIAYVATPFLYAMTNTTIKCEKQLNRRERRRKKQVQRMG